MSGSFKEGFKDREKEQIEIDDNETSENLSNGLVPIIQKVELDNYAIKF